MIEVTDLTKTFVTTEKQPGLRDSLPRIAAFVVTAALALLLDALIAVLIGLSALIFVAFSVIAGALAFWIGQSQNLAMQLQNAMLTFGLYPVDIFPGLVRVLLYTLIPAAFVGSIPALLLADFDWGRLAGLFLVTAALLLVARTVFALGLRRYESGNLVTTRS